MFEISKYVIRYPYLGAGEDEMGDETGGWGEPEPIGIWFFAPGGSEELVLAGHDRIVTSPSLYGPYGLPFTDQDECVVDGERYAVDGLPAQWQFPGTAVEGTHVKLKYVGG